MDEQLKKCLLKWEKEARLDNEIRIRRIALIPGLCTVDGEDIGSVLLSKKYSSFLHEDADKIQYNYTIFEKKLTFQTLKRMLAFLDGRERDINNSLERNISILSSLVSSLEKMIQDKNKETDAESSEVVEAIQKFISRFGYYKIISKVSINYLFDTMRKGIKRKYVTKGIYSFLIKLFFVSYSEIIINSDAIKTETIFLYLAAHEYFYGPNGKNREGSEMICQLSNMAEESIANHVADKVFLRLYPQMNSIKESKEEINRKIDHANDNIEQLIQSSGEILTNQGKTDEKIESWKRKRKGKPLKLTVCREAIEEVYDDCPEYRRQFKLHKYAIRNQLSSWNKYMKTDGEEGDQPYPFFEEFRCTSKKAFKRWVIDYYFPRYREDARRDAINRASRFKDDDTIYDPAQQDIIDEVDKNLKNDTME